MKTYSYTAYGLLIESRIELPELEGAEVPVTPPCNAERGASIVITTGKLPQGGLPDGEQLGPFLRTSDTAFYLEVPKIARFLVESGKAITIDPAHGVDAASVRLFLLGSAFGALLHQRGQLVMHGNAIRIEDQCILCVGQSGAGKSTLAAAFMQRGYDILADDVVPIDDQCRAVPGFPRIKLWQDAADKLGISTHSLMRVRPGIQKYSLPVPQQHPEARLPVQHVFILGTHNQPQPLIEHIVGMNRFIELRQNTYRMRYVEGMTMRGQHLKLCGTLAGRIQLTRITRPEIGFSIDALIDTLLAELPHSV